MEPISAVNFAAFDLNLLRVFDAVMREKSVTRAGERIGLSQPAVSAALNRLRHALNDALFVRRGQEMIPTPRAEALAAQVREALAALETALGAEDRFDPASADRIYTLLGADFFSSLLMPGLAARVFAAAPKVRLRLVDSAHGDVARLLLDDAIDAALERPLETPEWISSAVLFRSPFVVAAAADEAALRGLAPGAIMPLELFCALPHALRSIDGSMSGYVDEALAKAGVSRRVTLALPHFQGVALAVSRGGLIAALPKQFAEAVAGDLGLALYDLPVEAPAPEIRMYWHQRHDRTPAHRWLREQVMAAVEGW